jgi:Tfp pilus assembly protein PilE
VPKSVTETTDDRMISKPARTARGDEGFTLIDMLFVVALMGLLSTLALPGLMRARGAAHATSALATLKVISSAQLTFAITCGLGFYSPDLPTLGVPPPASLEAFLNIDLTHAPTVSNSNYSMSVIGTPIPGAPATCNGLAAGQSAAGYVAIADPLDVAHNGRYFATNGDGIIYEHNATLSAIMPETGVPASGVPIK